MKTKYYLIFLVLLLSVNFNQRVFAQKCLVFRYDADGNRIKRTVSNNCNVMRDVFEVQEVVIEEEVKVYPNPTNGSFKVFMPECEKHETAYYKFYDMNGVLLFEDKLHDNETEIDIGNKPAGVYLLKITNGDDVITKIVLKQ